MSDPQITRTARIRYRLTEQGHQKLTDAFITVLGEKRKFGSISELDPRTVARLYYNQQPFDLGSLMVLFRVLNLPLHPDDYAHVPHSRTADAAPDARSNQAYSSQPCSEPPSFSESDADGIDLEAEGALTGEPDGGAELLWSPFYMERQQDGLLGDAIRKRESTILLKGPRHSGKSSLLARGLNAARQTGGKVVCTDFDLLNADQLHSMHSLYRAFAGSLSQQCGGESPKGLWKTSCTPAENLEFYLRRLFRKRDYNLVWALDGVDALVGCGFHEDVFAMFRAWHNARANEPDGPWNYLTLILTYSTEASLLISSEELSPFNVARPILIGDFSQAELRALNDRYDSPLSESDEDRLFALVGGHPFLTRLALFEVKSGRSDLAEIERTAGLDGGLFRPYLEEIRHTLRHDTEYRSLVAAVTAGKPIVSSPVINRCFQRLRSAGVLKGECAEQAQFRCHLYGRHFARYPL